MPERGSVVEFAERNHVLTEGVPGNYSSATMPYHREMLEIFRNPQVRKIVYVTGSQVGKTTIMQALLHYAATCDPGPTMWLMPDMVARRRAVNAKLKPAIRASPNWRKQLAGIGRPITEEAIWFTRMDVFLSIPTSSQLAQLSCKFAFADEVDKLPPSTEGEGPPLKQLEARTRTFLNHKIVLSSTPTTRDAPAWATLEQSTFREWCVPCPHCGAFHPFGWDDIIAREWHRPTYAVKWEKRPEGTDHLIYSENVKSGAVRVWLVCPSCGNDIEEHSKSRMVLDGRFEARNPSVREIEGFHVPALCSPFVTVRGMVADWLVACHSLDAGDDREVRHFIQHQLAQCYREYRVAMGPERIVERCGTIPRGVVPSDIVALSAGVDVQHDRIYWAVTGWTPIGPRPHVVDWGMVRGAPEVSLPELDGIILAREFTRQDGQRLRVALTLVDCRDGVTAPAVYGYTGRRLDRMRPCMGENWLPAGQYYRFGSYSKNEDREIIGDHVVKLDVTRVKDWWARLMHRDVAEPHAVSFASEAATDNDFVNQMISEVRQILPGGRVKWVRRQNYENHWFDCAIYATGAAIIMGVLRSYVKATRQADPTKRDDAEQTEEPRAALEPPQTRPGQPRPTARPDPRRLHDPFAPVDPFGRG